MRSMYFLPAWVDYRYMALLCKERLRAHLLHMLFDYLIRSYRMSLAELQCLVHQLQLSDGTLDISTSVLVTPLSPDLTSLLTLLKLYFPEKTDEYGTSIKIAGIIDGAILGDKYSDELIMLVPTPWLFTTIAHDDDVLENVISPVVYFLVSSDITLFALHSPTSQIFDIDDEIAQHDLDEDSSSAFDLSPIDQRVSPTTGDVEIVDFSIANQPKELRIRLNLFIDERIASPSLLGSHLDVLSGLMRTCQALIHP
ncbi:hypothetical protein AAG906_008023 [Vitis piasezkii]